jgi:hypothetical protein
MKKYNHFNLKPDKSKEKRRKDEEKEWGLDFKPGKKFDQ